MSDTLALSPDEAANIAANVYFTLAGWEKVYAFKQLHGDKAKGAPSVTKGMATKDSINRNVFGSGSASLANTDLAKNKSFNTFNGTTGSNLLGRTKTGYGYLLQFERGNNSHLVIALRGTRPELGYPDLLTDGNAGFNRHMPGIGPVHAGFYDVYDSLLPVLAGASDIIKNSDVVHCVGHSLGGAVANLVAIHVARMGARVRLYTFGAPRVGLSIANYDKIMNAKIGESNIYRVSHNFDPIPMIPVMPYIHALPNTHDKNNFFISSPITHPTMGNHDAYYYINSVHGKNWSQLRADKLNEGYLDKQYFNSWKGSDSWLKQYLGHSANFIMGIVQRVLRGLLDTLGVGLISIATILDVLALAIRSGINILQATSSFMIKFISDCAKMFGMAADISIGLINKLYRKLLAEIAIISKQALAAGTKIANSKEFRIILAAATTSGSIGLLCI